MEPETPDYRATLPRNGQLRLVPWGPWLATGGPVNTLLHARAGAKIAIADLTIIRDEDEEAAAELIVQFRCGDAPEHRDTLREWAERVGYRRIWFEGELAELEPEPGGTAEVRCQACRARFVDSDASFWEFIRAAGAFPYVCTLCGADLPQWRRLVERKRAGTVEAESGRDRAGVSDRPSKGRLPSATHPRRPR